MSVREALALGCGMNARGSTEVIVATIGLSMAVLTQNLFTMIVTMAVVTTMAMPPMLRAALARLPISKEEKARLEREELDARGFVAKLERMLLAVDDSANGKFAARLAGYLAGVRGMPLTVMRVEEPQPKSFAPEQRHEEEVKQGASDAAAAAEKVEKEAPRPVDVTTHPSAQVASPETVAEMSRKGFDFLFVGIADVRAPDGAFSRRVTDLVEGFEGPLGILVPPEHDDPALQSGILVPVTGTDVSRRGAEVALVIAKAAETKATALYVAPGTQSGGYRTRRSQEAVLRDVAQLASRYELPVATAIEHHELAQARILKRAANRDGLIVMGVNRRPGDVLFFGNTAAALMRSWKGPILFVAS
jgi:nucleotide-binding universal stress UspA family protein